MKYFSNIQKKTYKKTFSKIKHKFDSNIFLKIQTYVWMRIKHFKFDSKISYFKLKFEFESNKFESNLKKFKSN